MSKVKFTGKVGAKRMNFMKQGTKELHSAYYATVESTDGQMFTIKDPLAPFKLAEAATEKEAMEKAEQYLNRVGLG
ncbi:hypothetical protein LBW83_16725 [Bacillus velezensis]|uniref:hypothetical protein n=1 Tax=Bacillus velezensis TaxID=492670 RepID=UPI00145C1A19|nr:hypothetical protein [Bacillus velezensis]MCA1233254.1 hypothetical protein [Bacillus velezensis]MCA1311354.1 hypothetical protein [Bacillus velezensis]MCA1330409.1 hypothetical protein [Bacillus velezensis]NMP63597.1 hypothetical protein [Bacillus velezensis]